MRQHPLVSEPSSSLPEKARGAAHSQAVENREPTVVRGGLTWWQLSDLHWPADPSMELQRYIDNLLRHLRESVATSGCPNFAVFTGDIAYSGQSKEYDSVGERLMAPLRELLGDEVPMLFVPGNHDMDRDEALIKQSRLVTDLADPAAVDAFLGNPRNRANFADPFRSYSDFVAQWGPAGTDDAYRWTHTFTAAGRKLTVLGLNSAWAGFYHATDAVTESDRGRLLLSIDQAPEPAEDADFTFFAQHHPFEWLNEDICDPAVQSLRRNYQVGLFGHVHSPRELGQLSSPHSTVLRIPSMLLFGRPHGDDSARYPRGYSVGAVEVATGECCVRYFKYDSVYSQSFKEFTDVYADDGKPPTAVLKPRRAGAESAARTGTGARFRFNDALPEIARLRERVPELTDCDRDVRHGLDILQASVELVDRHDGLTPYLLDSPSFAFAYVLAELSVVRAHAAGGVQAQADFRVASWLKDDAARLLGAVPTGAPDLEELLRVVDHVSVAEPSRIRTVGDLRRAPVAMAFAYLWGLARLAQLLDNPGLIDGTGTVDQAGRNVLSVHEAPNGGDVLVFDLATTERRTFHLASEALHAVRRYFTELDDLWRKWQLIHPLLRFELDTPNWADRSVNHHEIRVDPRPVTEILMGRALYGDRQHVWLRELIQNALDATAMRAKSGEAGYTPAVHVERRSEHVVVIRDNGIGMTYQQVVNQLSVLGRSGWRSSAEAQQPADMPAFFGRFGIGFASVFSAAAAVDVRTRTLGNRPVDGVLVQFTAPDRPFYTDFTTCDIGTEITVTLTEPIKASQFKAALQDLFAYLPGFLHASPAPGIPNSLTTFSAVRRHGSELGRWDVLTREGRAQVGAHEAGFKVELLHDPQPHRGRSGRDTKEPNFIAIGFTSLTFSADGVRISERKTLRPSKTSDLDRYRATEHDLNLSGLYLTIDFARDHAPVLASRNELGAPDELQDEIEQLLIKELVNLVPDLVRAAVASARRREDRRRAVVQALSDVFRPNDRFSRNTTFHHIPELDRACTQAYLANCPVLVASADGTMRHLSLSEVDPRVCSVVVAKGLTETPVFPAFVRAEQIDQWLVAMDNREIILVNQAWPHDASLKTVDSASQLTENFQAVLPESRTGNLWRLLRSDYALSESTAFGPSLSLPLPQQRGARSVTRAQGIERRRAATSMNDRPRVFLNLAHPVIRALEASVSRSDREPSAERAVTAILDSLCEQVIDEDRITVRRSRWRMTQEELARLTGGDFTHLAVEDL
ncbi:metallophosphoesterase [Streptomyces sp. NPDC087422]|uniref:metallophosphoesterase family protein n=1 Tax=Streptomyces sp. NPDC087422 TaxID=3365786 RepID=UPI00382D1AB4